VVQENTHGVADAIVLHTTEPVKVKVLELYVRPATPMGPGPISRRVGAEQIRGYLGG